MRIKVLRWVDIIVVWTFILLFFWLTYLFGSRKSSLVTHPKKVLIIRIWWLWSALLTFPMIKQLQDTYGTSVRYDVLGSARTLSLMKRQWYFTSYFDLFRIKDLLKLLFSCKSYDVVIDTEEYFRTTTLLSMWLGKISIWFGALRNRRVWYSDPVKYNDQQHVVLTFLDLLKPLGIKTVSPVALEPVKVTEQEILQWDTLLEPYQGMIKICLHTWGAESSTERFWSPSHRIDLIGLLHAKYHDRIVFFLSGTKIDLPVIHTIQDSVDAAVHVKILELSLFAFCYVLSKCDGMISNDTWPMHLGAAMGTKTIGLFGPNLPQRFGPYPADKNIALYEGDGTAYINVHLWQFLPCSQSIVDQITPQMVYEQVVKIIG